jgi:predicted acyl esterase
MANGLYTQPDAKYIPVTLTVRDGKWLAADLYANDTTHALPVILTQTPYDKNYYHTRVGLPEAGGSAFHYDSLHYNFSTSRRWSDEHLRPYS